MDKAAAELIADLVAGARQALGKMADARELDADTTLYRDHCQAVVDVADGLRPDMLLSEYSGHLEAIVRINSENVRKILTSVGRTLDDITEHAELGVLRDAFGGGDVEGRA